MAAGTAGEARRPAGRLRVVFCWDVATGYMAACWRELARREGIDLFVLALAPRPADLAPYADDVLAGVPHRLLDGADRGDAALVRALLRELDPDVLFICGWHRPAYARLYGDPALRRARVVLVMDNPLRLDWRQRLGRFLIAAKLRRADMLLVPGERSWRLARHWGVPERKIRRGAYGCDQAGLRALHTERLARPAGWPRSFLFVGRYDPVKGVDTLLDGYARYRGTRPDPWPLRCAGVGPLGPSLREAPGVEDLGFVQPRDMPAVWRDAGAFVLCSRYEPWGVVNLEACAAGLPVLCTEACGSGVELVRHLHNGLVVPTGDAEAVARGLAWLHDRHAELPEIGARSQPFAAAYSAERWADRVCAMLAELG